VNCPECGGCTDDECRGSCRVRFCKGAYMGEPCDRCPAKVPKTIVDTKGRDRTIQVRCNGGTGHQGNHHWDPWRVGRD
jgi:hypothetical protein